MCTYIHFLCCLRPWPPWHLPVFTVTFGAPNACSSTVSHRGDSILFQCIEAILFNDILWFASFLVGVHLLLKMLLDIIKFLYWTVSPLNCTMYFELRTAVLDNYAVLHITFDEGRQYWNIFGWRISKFDWKRSSLSFWSSTTLSSWYRTVWSAPSISILIDCVAIYRSGQKKESRVSLGRISLCTRSAPTNTM